MYERKPTILKDVLDKSLPGQVADRMATPALARVWRAAVGDHIAQKARPVGFDQKGRLVVAVAGAVWRNELKFLEPEIMAKLQEAGIPAAGLRFSNPIPPPPAPPPAREAPPEISPEAREKLAASIKVSNPRLKQALTNLGAAMAAEGALDPDEQD